MKGNTSQQACTGLSSSALAAFFVAGQDRLSDLQGCGLYQASVEFGTEDQLDEGKGIPLAIVVASHQDESLRRLQENKFLDLNKLDLNKLQLAADSKLNQDASASELARFVKNIGSQIIAKEFGFEIDRELVNRLELEIAGPYGEVLSTFEDDAEQDTALYMRVIEGSVKEVSEIDMIKGGYDSTSGENDGASVHQLSHKFWNACMSLSRALGSRALGSIPEVARMVLRKAAEHPEIAVLATMGLGLYLMPMVEADEASGPVMWGDAEGHWAPGVCRCFDPGCAPDDYSCVLGECKSASGLVSFELHQVKTTFPDCMMAVMIGVRRFLRYMLEEDTTELFGMRPSDRLRFVGDSFEKFTVIGENAFGDRLRFNMKCCAVCRNLVSGILSCSGRPFDGITAPLGSCEVPGSCPGPSF